MRVLMFAMGYHHIRVEGTVDKRAGTIVSNHCSFLDPFILMNYVTPMFVAAAENLQKPLFGPYLRVTQSIVLYRSDPNSRAYTKYNIMERTKPERGDDFLPLMIFPEGTTHAQDCLLQFKDGAFRPGTPVQPAILKYSNRRYDPAWTISGDTLGALMARCFFQFYNSVTVKFLPLYIPNEEEKKDPYLYANNVRNYMAAEGHMELTPTWLEDANLFRKALHLNAVGCNLLCKEVTDHATRKKLASLLADFSKMDTNNDGLLDYNEFMTAVVPKGNKKDRVAAITLFNIMDKDGSDSIDFKEFVAGLYMNSNEKSDDVDSKVEFVFSVYGLDKMSEISQEHAIDVLVKHHPLLPREAIVDKVQSAWKGIERDVAATITMEEFAHLVTADKDIYTYSLPAALQKAMTE
ncbi:hypothetical protein SARC_02141 [Sphaeroforma arctica JP610]|uniref:EF-hand domain-containing protein n=1 Tax=Sphaeroforma arctica JP610 TaxID=667725 RepID=A0A0L0G9J3_9EUKA|nr:hypothetical protein SARC_02141 [Sphaeroforma arctica JP610]KNC85692.1 hypothetical protein SARC_02141 [Sphaeroforma arctica JP610]|eukprot:XP_014159594.1 hypothetical protein SARC_02141 [Sphaeroforma arctica JP610]